MKPVTDTINLVEDRIAEILESGNMKIKVGCNGLLTDKCLRAFRKHGFLKKLSTDLAKFHVGRY